MAAPLRSSVLLALRRAATSRLSSAGRSNQLRPRSGFTCKQGTRRRCGNYDASRSMFDPEACSRNPIPPANPDLDKADGLFTAAACVGMVLFCCLVDGVAGLHYFGWCNKEENASRQPRMTSRRSRR